MWAVVVMLWGFSSCECGLPCAVPHEACRMGLLYIASATDDHMHLLMIHLLMIHLLMIQLIRISTLC